MDDMDERTAGTTWQGQPCSRGMRNLLDATLEAASLELLNKFGVRADSLSTVVETQLRANMERRRNMLLCDVDELEQALGIEPRTSAIRQYWKDSGRPRL